MRTTISVLTFTLLAFQTVMLSKAPNESIHPSHDEIVKLELTGKELADAVLRKDIEAVIRHDRADLLEADRQSLQEKSDLYCFIFDSSCIKWNEKSIREKLGRMKKLEVAAKNWGASSDGYYSFLLVFYDGAKYSRSQISSEQFLCSHLAAFATWTFRYINGSWQSANPPFDAEVDSPCSSE